MKQLSDEELIAEARRAGGVATADPYLNELFGRHQRRVVLWCLRYAGNREDAADLAQDILARAWRNLDSYRGNSKFTTWLYMVCRNHCLNQVKQRAQTSELLTEVLTVVDQRSNGAEERLDQQARYDLARRWIEEGLDETERKVVWLHFAEEMPIEAITRLLQLQNASGAKAYLVSARRKLQESARRWKAKHESTPPR